jgi:hypothetical protein
MCIAMVAAGRWRHRTMFNRQRENMSLTIRAAIKLFSTIATGLLVAGISGGCGKTGSEESTAERVKRVEQQQRTDANFHSAKRASPPRVHRTTQVNPDRPCQWRLTCQHQGALRAARRNHAGRLLGNKRDGRSRISLPLFKSTRRPWRISTVGAMPEAIWTGSRKLVGQVNSVIIHIELWINFTILGLTAAGSRTHQTCKGNHMDQINVQVVESAEGVDTCTRIAGSAYAAERMIRQLNDWEMVLAGGGDGMPCWG